MDAFDQGSLSPFFKDLRTLSKFVALMVRGHGVPAMQRTAIEALGREALTRMDGEDTYDKHLDDVKEFEGFATQERESGFPYLHGIATVRMWSIITAGIDNVLLTILKDNSRVQQTKILEKIKAPVSVLVSTSDEERAEFLREAIKRELAIDLKPGVGKFEDLLNVFNLGAEVPPSIRKLLLQLCETRNVIVHRNGRVDKKFLTRCPWIEIKLGEPIRITPQDFHMFFTASVWYVFDVQRRLLDARIEKADLLKAHIDENFTGLLETIERISTCPVHKWPPEEKSAKA